MACGGVGLSLMYEAFQILQWGGGEAASNVRRLQNLASNQRKYNGFLEFEL